jgi:hypothetical protein
LRFPRIRLYLLLFTALVLCALWIWDSMRAHRDVNDDSYGLGIIRNQLGIAVLNAEVSFPVATFHGPIDGKSVSDDVLHSYARLAAIELSVYPSDLFRRSNLEGIVI